MKNGLKICVAAFLVASLAIPANAIVTEGQTQALGQTNYVGQGPFRRGVEGQQMGSNVAGDFYEGARLGQVFTIKTASAGTSFTTAGVSPLAAAGIAWLALYNPAGSAVNLEIENISIAGVSGTPGVGAQVYDLGCSQNITAAQNAVPVGSLIPSMSGVGLGYTQTALTGSTVLKEVGISCYSPFAGAMAATSPGLQCSDNIQGRFVVAPGCVFAIQTTAAGTAHIAAGSLTYRVAIP